MSLPKNRILKVTILSIALASAVAGPSAMADTPVSPGTLGSPLDSCDVEAHPIEIWLTEQQVNDALQQMAVTMTNVTTVLVPGSQVHKASNVSFVEVTLPQNVAVAAAARLQGSTTHAITFLAAPQELLVLPVTGGFKYSAGPFCMYGRQDEPTRGGDDTSTSTETVVSQAAQAPAATEDGSSKRER